MLDPVGLEEVARIEEAVASVRADEAAERAAAALRIEAEVEVPSGVIMDCEQFRTEEGFAPDDDLALSRLPPHSRRQPK